MIAFEILILIIIFVGFECLQLEKCVYDQSLDYCLIENFDRISDIKIACEDNSYSSLVLAPNNKIEFNEKLIIANCAFDTIYLNNFKSFTIENEPFDIKFYSVKFSNSDVLFSFKHDDFVQNFFNMGFKIVHFNRVRYFSNTPRLTFKDSNFSSLTLDHMIDTKLMKNYLSFERKSNVSALNSFIDELELCLFKLNLDNNILDEYVFKNIKKLRIIYQPKDIQVGVLKPFVHLKELELLLFSLKSFFHSSGTKWLIGLNSLVNVNYSENLTTIDKSNQVVTLFQNYFSRQDEYTFPNEDFCLFIDFPHMNFVLPVIEKCFNTCTFQWLVQYHSFLMLDYYKKCELENLNICNYSLMTEACLSKNVSYNESQLDFYFLNDQNYKNKSYDLILSVYLIPAFSILGIFTNLLNILTLSSKKFQKELKNRMFKQMLICSYINLIICIINLLELTINCIDPYGYFCMLALVNLKVYRYIVLTIYIYIGSVMKTCSKLVQIAIALDRYILSTGTKNKLLLRFAKLNLKLLSLLFLFFSFFSCFFHGFPKVFQKYFRKTLAFYFWSIFTYLDSLN
jgi:hypothetical protein